MLLGLQTFFFFIRTCFQFEKSGLYIKPAIERKLKLQ